MTELEYYIKTYDEILDIADYLNVVRPEYGLDKGTSFKICCPIHDETEPSFSYSDKLGIWTCFGACHTSGKVTKLHHMLMKKRYGSNISIVQAMNDLQNIFPNLLPELSFEKKAKKELELNIDFDSMINNFKYKRPIKLLDNNQDINDYILMEFLRNPKEV